MSMEKNLDGMHYPLDRRVTLAIFWLDGEIEWWWLDQRTMWEILGLYKYPDQFEGVYRSFLKFS